MTTHHLRRFATLPVVQLSSLVINLVLAVTLVMVWQSQRESRSTTSPVVAKKTAPAAMKTAQAASPAVAAASPSTFHWRQIDAPDFPSFVKNLRSIGCPEATIQDIVRGELREIFTAKRQAVEREITTSPITARAGLEQRLLQLHTEEDTLLVSAMGGTPVTPTATAGSSATTSLPGATAAPSSSAAPDTAAIAGAAMTPAAFLVGNDPAQPAAVSSLSVTPTDPHLDQSTTQAISQMRATFATSMAGAGTDSSSQVYRQRWLSAQRASDEQFSSLFGGDAFVHAQLQAVQAAAAASPKP